MAASKLEASPGCIKRKKRERMIRRARLNLRLLFGGHGQSKPAEGLGDNSSSIWILLSCEIQYVYFYKQATSLVFFTFFSPPTNIYLLSCFS